MIYLFFIISFSGNVLLLWYIRKLLQKYWFDVEVRERFTKMLEQYGEALRSLHSLEELYGEEIIKKAIAQTDFVIEACKEFKESIDTQTQSQAIEEDGEDEEGTEEDNSVENNKKDGPIRIREGEKITQDADRYRRIVIDDI